jgi:hypothetical protein
MISYRLEGGTVVKRVKRILKIGAAVLGLLLAILLIGNAVLIWTTGARLEERLADIRNVGDPVTLADLGLATPPPNQNAAVYLRRARHDAEALAKELFHIDDSFTEIEGRPLDAQQKAIRAIPGGYPQAIRLALEAYPHVLPLLEQAAACPDYNPELAYTAGPEPLLESVLSEVQEFRRFTNILRAQASFLSAQGKGDDALRICLVSFRLTRHLEREPLLISYLVVVACRAVAIGQVNAILRAGPVSDAVRAELDKELAISEDVGGYQRALKGERAYAISSFGSSFPINWLNRAYFNNEECHLIDGINEQMSLATRPYAVSEERLEQHLGGPFHGFSALHLPALMKTRTAMERARAQIRCLRILNALQKHGPWPDKEPKLSDLGLPAEVTTGPYDGSPIKLKQVGSEWLIYCVGPDLKDHGGQLAGFADVGLGPVPDN